MTRIAIMVAGAVAMVIGASSTMWWSGGTQESLGLREALICADHTCSPFAYREGLFATLGSSAYYAAFATAAVALIAVVARWLRPALVRRTAVLAAIAGVASLGLAIAFIATRPTSLDFASDAYTHMRLFTSVLSSGWALVAYIAGAVVVIASADLRRIRRN
jgi:hypothetical protein